MRLHLQNTDCQGVYRISLENSAVSVDILLEKLRKHAAWDRQPPGSSDIERWSISSLYDWQTADTDLQNFCRWFKTDSIKRQLLELASADPVYQDHWSKPDIDCMSRIASTYGFYVETPAHFEDHPWHTDSKNLVIQCMLYIVSDTADNRGTWFSRDSAVLQNEQWAEITKVDAAPYQGWLLINSDRSYHRGLNYSDHARYCLKFGIQLDLQPPLDPAIYCNAQ